MAGKITIFGASGYTGQLVVAELKRLGLSFDIAGRSREKLASLAQRLDLAEETRQIAADPLQPQSLPALFDAETRVLINCVGPFTRLGEPVVKAAVAAGVHYLDITGEQSFMAKVFDYYDLPAQLKNCALVPACGVEYALSNWLAAIVTTDLQPLDSIVTATNVLSIQPTSGTQLSLFQALSEPSWAWQNGQRVRRLTGSQRRTFDFLSGKRTAIFAPFGDTITLPRQFSVKNVATFMVVPAPLALSTNLFAPLLPTTSKLTSLLLQPLLKSGRGPDIEKRLKARWEIIAIAENSHQKAVGNLTASDAYGLTAKIIGYAARQLLAPTFSGKGALGPAQAFDSRAALEYLRDFGLSFQLKML